MYLYKMVLVELFQEIGLFIYKQSTPLIILLSDLYEKYYENSTDIVKEDIPITKHEFNYEMDIIKVRYEIKDKSYIFCINRTNPLNLKNVVETELEEIKVIEDYVMTAELNGKDITSRINMYIGSNACHLKYNDLKIKYFLTQEEIDCFEKFYIMDSMCNEKEYKSFDDLLDLEIV